MTTLSMRGRYEQAKKFTSLQSFRYPAYICPAESQPTHWHIWFDGEDIVSLVCDGAGDTRNWRQGPAVSPADLSSGTDLVRIGSDILRGAYGMKTKGVGIILHIACGTATSPVRDTFDDLSKLAQVSTLAINMPDQVMLSAPTDFRNYRWRVLPLATAKKGKILLFRVGVEEMAGATSLAEINCPISISVRCAQMEAIATCSWLIDGIENAFDGEERALSKIAILYYRTSTILILFNRQGGIDIIRHLLHSNGKMNKELFAEFSQLVKNTDADNERISVTVFDFASGGDEVVKTIQSKTKVENQDIRCQIVTNEIIPSIIESLGIATGLPSNIVFPPELLVEYKKVLTTGARGGALAADALLRSAEADFLDENTGVSASKVESNTMFAVLAARVFKWGAVAGTVIGVVLCILSIMKSIRSEQWLADTSTFATSTSDLAALTKEQAEGNRIKSIFNMDITLWQAMEVIPSLFPEGDSLKLKSASFALQNKELTWSFSGYATDSGMSAIRAMQNPAMLETAFANIYKLHKINIFANLKKGKSTVSVKELKNPQYQDGSEVEGPTQYPLQFDLKVSFALTSPTPNVQPKEKEGQLPKPSMTAP